MKTIFLLSILLSLPFCALSCRGLDELDSSFPVDGRLLCDEEPREDPPSQEETQLGEEENIWTDLHEIGEDTETTLFLQTPFLDTGGAVIGDAGGAVGAIFDDGTSVTFDSPGSSSTGPTGSGRVNGIDDFTDFLTSANYWSFEYGPTSTGLDYATDFPTNVRIEGGFLSINALKEPFEGAEYTSASVSTQGKISVQYGLFVVRAKFSYTKGVYPLFMLFSEDRSCSVVVVGGGISPNTIFSQILTPFSNSSPATYTLPSGTTEDFHDYGVIWYPYAMDFYVDYTLYFSINAMSFGGQWPFDMFPMFLNLQLAVGGPSGNPDESSVFPQEFVVDAVGIVQG